MDSRVIEFLLSPWGLLLLGLCIGSFLNVVVHRLPLMLERGWKLESAEMLGVKVDAAEPLRTARSRARVAPRAGRRSRGTRTSRAQLLVAARPVRGVQDTNCGSLPTHRSHDRRLVRRDRLALRCQPRRACCGARLPPTLVALAAIDWDTTLLPDNLTLPLLWAGLVASATGWTIPLSDALWGAVVGYLSLWSVYWLFKLTTGKEGMGFGDFKLLAALGAWLGVKMILPIVLAASMIGAVVGVVMKLAGSLREGRYVPFGPFLAGAGMVVMFAGQARVLGWLGW